MTMYYQDATLTLLLGDAVEQLRTLPDGSVDCVVTSPPYYGLRDYGQPGQIGLDATPAEYVAALAVVFAEVHRVLFDDGTLWLNLGDSYASKIKGSGGTGRSTLLNDGRSDAARVSGALRAQERQQMEPHRLEPDRPDKNLLGIPWRVAFALQDAGWYLRNAIVWHKPNAMPESVRDRLSTRYELMFLLTRSPRYWFDLDAIRPPIRDEWRGRGLSKVHGAADGVIVKHGTGKSSLREPSAVGRNPGDVWEISTAPLSEAHFAAFPPELPRRCILAGCQPGGTVLDPFSGAGTTALVAQRLGRKAIGIDLVAAYHDMALRRMSDAPLPFEDGEAS